MTAMNEAQQRSYLVDLITNSIAGGTEKYFKMNYIIDGRKLCFTAAAKALGVSAKWFETISSHQVKKNTASHLPAQQIK
jgi:hypothetical protein